MSLVTTPSFPGTTPHFCGSTWRNMPRAFPERSAICSLWLGLTHWLPHFPEAESLQWHWEPEGGDQRQKVHFPGNGFAFFWHGLFHTFPEVGMAWDHVFDISLWQRPARALMYKTDLMREPDKFFCFRLDWCFHRCWILYSLYSAHHSQTTKKKGICLTRTQRFVWSV